MPSQTGFHVCEGSCRSLPKYSRTSYGLDGPQGCLSNSCFPALGLNSGSLAITRESNRSLLAKCIAGTFPQPQPQWTPISFHYSALIFTALAFWGEGRAKKEGFNMLCWFLYLPSVWTRKQALNLSGISALRKQPAYPPTSTSSFTHDKSKWEVSLFSHLYWKTVNQDLPGFVEGFIDSGNTHIPDSTFFNINQWVRCYFIS